MHFPESSSKTLSLLLAPVLGAAFVFGGYWIPPLELTIALSVPAIGALAILLLSARKLDVSPRLRHGIWAYAAVVSAWILLASSPYLVRSFLLQREASRLPAWDGEQPAFRYWVVANNQEDYRGIQIAREPLANVEAFYQTGMATRGWRLERRREAHGLRYLVFAKCHRKVAYHLGPAWDGRATSVEIFRVSFWPGADGPGSGRRAWYRWVSRLRESLRRSPSQRRDSN